MRRQTQLLAILGVALLTLSFSAQQAVGLTIDFGPALLGQTDPFAILTNQLSGLGVEFSTTDPDGVVWNGLGGPSSFEYSIAAGFPADASNTMWLDPIRVDINSTRTGVFSEVSIAAYDGGGDIDTMTFKAFDSADTLLDMVSVTDVYSFPGIVSTVTGANIAYVTFEATTGGAFPHGLSFDDLCIGPCDTGGPVIPEPGAALLFGTGMLVVGSALQRRAA